MKVGNNIIRLLKAALEQRNKEAAQADRKSNQATLTKHLKNNQRLIAAHEKAAARLKTAEQALEAVGIDRNFHEYYVKDWDKTGLVFLSTPEVRLERVLAELAGADEKAGKAILGKYGVKI